MHLSRIPSWNVLAGALMLAAALSGCGGRSSSTSATTPGSSAGVFRDAPVNGLTYTATPSGVTGVTGDNGVDGGFRYTPGDTVSFRLGGLTLGSTTGAAQVSPADIAGDDVNVATNLLVLLQSLDSDATDGRIVVSLPSSTNLSSLVLTQAPTTFAAAPTFTAAVSAAGGTVVDEATARAHAVSQFWSQVQGVWRIEGSGTEAAILRIDEQGRYLIGESGTSDSSGQSGVEMGQLTWDPTTQRATASVTLDTNGEWGFSHPRGGAMVLRFDGTNLSVVDLDDVAIADELTTLQRATSQAGALAGVWALQLQDGQAPPFATATFIFRGGDRYFMIDPLGDTPDPGEQSCGGPGVELGTTTYSEINHSLTVDSVPVDSNGCAGLFNGSPGGTGRSSLRNITFSSDGNTITVDLYTQAGDLDGSATLVRVTP